MAKLTTVFKYECEHCGEVTYVDTSPRGDQVEFDECIDEAITQHLLEIIGVDALRPGETVEDVIGGDDVVWLESVIFRSVLAPMAVQCSNCDITEEIEWDTEDPIDFDQGEGDDHDDGEDDIELGGGSEDG